VSSCASHTAFVRTAWTQRTHHYQFTELIRNKAANWCGSIVTQVKTWRNIRSLCFLGFRGWGHQHFHIHGNHYERKCGDETGRHEFSGVHSTDTHSDRQQRAQHCKDRAHIHGNMHRGEYMIAKAETSCQHAGTANTRVERKCTYQD
jgi:hypothetical protein